MYLYSVGRKIKWVNSLALLGICCALNWGWENALAEVPVRELRADGVPEVLQAWQDWVLRGEEARRCPEVGGQYEDGFCAWAGVLKIEAGKNGARFALNWEVVRDSTVILPGSHAHWPQELRVDGKPAPVFDAGGPALRLTAGQHEVSGFIPWTEQPQALEVPESIALLTLSLDGKVVSAPERQGAALILRTEAGEGGSTALADSLEYQIYRKLTDGVPAQLSTLIRLKVSGKARRIKLASALPAQFVPTALESRWPAQLDADGVLRIEARPGEETITVTARLSAPLTQVGVDLPKIVGESAGAAQEAMQETAQEVWSYEAAPALRVTAMSPGDKNATGDVETAVAVDPRQAGVPAQWQHLPAFAVSQDAVLRVEERARGQGQEAENHRLSLARSMWLDFSGDGFFARDRIEGVMRHGWRFDVARPYTLERADSLDERSAPQQRRLRDTLLAQRDAALLVTQGAEDGLTGVEWRAPQVTLNASLRLSASAGLGVSLPVTGWRTAFDSVATTLNLPYGYYLIAAPGADSAADAWVEEWTILRIFFTVLFTLIAWQLLGRTGGLMTGAYLFLATPEAGAPINALIAVVVLALARQALPPGRLKKALCGLERVAFIGLAAMAIFFMPTQLRYALYPQLEDTQWTPFGPPVFKLGTIVDDWDERPVSMEMMEERGVASPLPHPAAAPVPPPPVADMAARDFNNSARARTFLKSMSESAPLAQKQRYAQSSVTQTGGGEPDWGMGRQYHLEWSGPVTADQDVRLILCPPWLTRLLRLTMVGLLGALVWRLLRTIFPPRRKQNEDSGTKPTSAAPAANAAALLVTLALAGGALFALPDTAKAASALPSPEMLADLKARLLEAPECAPHCFNLASARIDAARDVFHVLLEAHVEAASAIPLPEARAPLYLRAVRVNGESRPLLRVEGRNYLALARGVHRVELDYLPAGDQVSLQFPAHPARVEISEVSGKTWQVEGVDENRLLRETLNFTRVGVVVVPATTQKPTSGDNEEDGEDEEDDASPAGEDAASGVGRAAQPFPAFIHISRELDLGLDWTLRAEARRIAPREGGFTLAVPLLAGEHVITPDIRVHGDISDESTQAGTVHAAFGHQDTSFVWNSRLDKHPVLELVAPALDERAETWRVTVGPSLHLQWNGVPVTLAPLGETHPVVFEFHPLPGEKLTLTVNQPEITSGAVRAIDQVRLAENVGAQASQYTLDFTLRASQGGEFPLKLPEGVELLRVEADQRPLNIEARDGSLSLPVAPGAQSYRVAFRANEAAGFLTRSPRLDLGLPAANITLTTHMPEQRWILAVGGPDVGPAVLYWGELLVALVLAFFLARSGETVLGYPQAFLLVLGFSTFSWLPLFVVVAWLMALDWRARLDVQHYEAMPVWHFNSIQIGLALLTIATLALLVNTVSSGLLSSPDMSIRGNGSGGQTLHWFTDRIDGALPTTTVVSLPLWVYRGAMLAWAIWLAYTVSRWLNQCLRAWLKNGYWKKRRSLAEYCLRPSPGEMADDADTRDEKGEEV
ncbi:hypothetical protein FACS189475_06240 [Betaproteobacteria bacterium]|nr:hypothetical protein FACS189475_06240 [Betaproteobacteria bacterium]